MPIIRYNRENSYGAKIIGKPELSGEKNIVVGCLLCIMAYASRIEGIKRRRPLQEWAENLHYFNPLIACLVGKCLHRRQLSEQ